MAVNNVWDGLQGSQVRDNLNTVIPNFARDRAQFSCEDTWFVPLPPQFNREIPDDNFRSGVAVENIVCEQYLQRISRPIGYLYLFSGRGEQSPCGQSFVPANVAPHGVDDGENMLLIPNNMFICSFCNSLFSTDLIIGPSGIVPSSEWFGNFL